MIRSLGFRICATAVPAILFLHCAHVEPPPGGPVDTRAPRVTAVFPAPGARNVSRDAGVVLKFSEWIDRGVGRGSVFLSPPLPGRLKTKVEGDRLLITLPAAMGGLRPNTAYRLTVLGSLKDLHGVAMGRAFSIAFTTGDGFDSGAVAGRAEAPDRQSAVLAALYRVDGRDPGTVLPRTTAEIPGFHPDSLPAPGRELPAFTTSADSTGAFAFDSVSQGKYALLAYEDVNGNLSPDFGFEPMGVGPADVKLTPRGDPQSLHLAPLDTAPVRITQVRFTADSTSGDSLTGTVRIKFSRLPRPDSVANPAGYRLIDLSGGKSPPLIAAGWDPVPGEAVLQTPFLRKGNRYRLNRLDIPGGTDTTFSSREEFSASAVSDTAEWTLTFLDPPDVSGYPRKIEPGNEILPGDEYRLRSSRTLTDARFHALQERLEAKRDTLPLKVALARNNPAELTLKTESPLRFGQTLRLRLAPGHRDSSDTVFRAMASARVLDSLRLGDLRFKIPARLKKWTLVLQALQPSVELSLKPGASDSVRVAPLPAGRYRLAAFLDRDGDGAWSPGGLSPWTPQEPYEILLESLEVVPGLVTDLTPRLTESGIPAPSGDH